MLTIKRNFITNTPESACVGTAMLHKRRQMTQKQAHHAGKLGKADLHMHSTYSDGMATIEQILDRVQRETNLDVIALTDHDVIEGALRARELWTVSVLSILVSGANPNGFQIFRTLVDYGGSYYLVAPIGPSGIAFLGDSGKFVSCGKKRIEQLSDNGTLRVLVRFAPGEEFVALRLYSATEPNVSADSGTVGRLHHHGNNLYRVIVQPDANGAAALTFQVAAAAQA